MEASSANSNIRGSPDHSQYATSPYAKHTSLRGAAGYRALKTAAQQSQNSESSRNAEPAESSSSWANRVRSQKNAGFVASPGDVRVRESVSRSGRGSVSRLEEDETDAVQRRGVSGRKQTPQSSSMTPWERLSQVNRPASRPSSRQFQNGVKIRRTPNEGDAGRELDTTTGSNRPPSRRKTEGRIVPQAAIMEIAAENDPETYDTYSRGFSKGLVSEGRPAWNQGTTGAVSRPAWTTGPQAGSSANRGKGSRPNSRLSSRQASREGSVVGDISYQLEEGVPSKESSRTDVVSISSHDGGVGLRGRKQGGVARPGSSLSLVDVFGFAGEGESGTSGNDENREPGARPFPETSVYGRPSPPSSDQPHPDLHAKKARLSANRPDSSKASGVRHSWGGLHRAQVSASRTSASPRLNGGYQRPESARDWSPIRKRKDDPLQPQTLAAYMATPRSPLRSPVCPPRPFSARNADVRMTPLSLDTPTAREAPLRRSPTADEDAEADVTLTDVQQRISAARHNTTDLRPATTANVTRAGLLSAPPPGAVKEVDLSALADKLFQPREHMPRSGSLTSASLPAASDALPPNGLSVSRRQSARRDVTGTANQGPPGGGEAQGQREQTDSEEARKALRRPPSRQRPPPESLHLFTGDSSGPAAMAASLELEARPETTAGHMRVGGLAARAVQSEPINRLHKLFIRPPSRQRPPPEALCLGDIEAATTERSYREIYSSSDCETP